MKSIDLSTTLDQLTIHNWLTKPNIRAGKHDVTACDWDQYRAFADKHIE